MKGNGVERDTLDGVIADLEYVQRTWRNGQNQLNYATLRYALEYLRDYREIGKVKTANVNRLIDLLREVRGEK